MSGGGAEAGAVTIKAMVGANQSEYPKNKSGAIKSGGARGDGDGGIGVRVRLG